MWAFISETFYPYEAWSAFDEKLIAKCPVGENPADFLQMRRVWGRYSAQSCFPGLLHWTAAAKWSENFILTPSTVMEQITQSDCFTDLPALSALSYQKHRQLLKTSNYFHIRGPKKFSMSWENQFIQKCWISVLAVQAFWVHLSPVTYSYFYPGVQL